jgi:hypothetical protein
MIPCMNMQILIFMLIIECRVLTKFEDVVQSFLNMCHYGVCSLILVESHTNQI